MLALNGSHHSMEMGPLRWYSNHLRQLAVACWSKAQRVLHLQGDECSHRGAAGRRRRAQQHQAGEVSVLAREKSEEGREKNMRASNLQLLPVSTSLLSI